MPSTVEVVVFERRDRHNKSSSEADVGVDAGKQITSETPGVRCLAGSLMRRNRRRESRAIVRRKRKVPATSWLFVRSFRPWKKSLSITLKGQRYPFPLLLAIGQAAADCAFRFSSFCLPFCPLPSVFSLSIYLLSLSIFSPFPSLLFSLFCHSLCVCVSHSFFPSAPLSPLAFVNRQRLGSTNRSGRSLTFSTWQRTRYCSWITK